MSAPELSALDLPDRLHRCVLRMVLDGTLPPGYRLPATRALSLHLKMARVTVEQAYARLRADGYLQRHVGKGSFVCEQIDPSLLHEAAPRPRSTKGSGKSPASAAAQKATAKDPSGTDSRSTAALSNRGNLMIAGGPSRNVGTEGAFVTGIPDTRTFPTAIWERLQRQAVKEYRNQILLYGDPQGAEPLRQAIAEYLNQKRGTRANPEQILILNCAQQAFTLCAQLLCDAGDTLLVEDPTYRGAKRAFEAAGVRVAPMPVDAGGLIVDEVVRRKTAAKGIYITPSHQYPTGATLALSRRLELIGWAKANNTWIIEDDYDSDFHYEGQPTACVHSLDRSDRTIYVGTFSKSLFPGIRLGYMVLPPELVRPLTTARTLIDGHSNYLSQLTLAKFISGGFFATHIRAVRKLYDERRTVIATEIDKQLRGIAHATLPPGGLQLPCFLAEDFPLGESETIGLLKAKGIQLTGLSQFYANAPAPQGWLLGFASLTPAEIRSGIRKIANTLKEQIKSKA